MRSQRERLRQPCNPACVEFATLSHLAAIVCPSDTETPNQGERVPSRAETMKRSVVLLLAFLTVAIPAGNAQATFPGSNGRIAFYDFFAVFGPPRRVGQIYSMEPDGSDMTEADD